MWGQPRLVILAIAVAGRLYRRVRSGWSPFWTQCDFWLQRLNHLAQLGLLTAAVYGYFHTVVPLFNKERIEREVQSLRAQARRVAIGLAVSDMQTRCTDLPKPPAEAPPILPKFGGSAQPSHEDKGKFDKDELLEIPIAECLRERIAGITPTDSFTKEDLARINTAIEARIPVLVAKRGEAVGNFQRLKESHAGELRALELAERSRAPDTTLPIGYDALKRRLNLWFDFERTKMELDFPYRNLIIKSIKEAGDQAVADVQ